MSTQFFNVGPYSDWWYVKHEVTGPGLCTLEIDQGHDPDAFNLAPCHAYILVHQTTDDGGCMFGMLQLPKTSLALSAKVAAAGVVRRLCFGCDQSRDCPRPLQPICDQNNVLQCVQNP